MRARYHILANGIPYRRASSLTEARTEAARLMLEYPGFAFRIKEENHDCFLA